MTNDSYVLSRPAEAPSKNSLSETTPPSRNQRCSSVVKASSRQESQDAITLAVFLVRSGLDHYMPLPAVARMAIALDLFEDQWGEKDVVNAVSTVISSFDRSIVGQHLYYLSDSPEDQLLSVTLLPAPGMPAYWSARFCAEKWIARLERDEEAEQSMVCGEAEPEAECAPLVITYKPTCSRLRQLDFDWADYALNIAWDAKGYAAVFTATEAAEILRPLTRNDVAELVREGHLENRGSLSLYQIPYASIVMLLVRAEEAGVLEEASAAIGVRDPNAQTG